MGYQVTTPPTEPVTLAEARLHLRVDDTTEDTLIGALITAAREYCQHYTQRSIALITALTGNQQREFGLYLKMPYTRRDHPLVAMVQQAFGWTDAEVDALFAEADAV